MIGRIAPVLWFALWPVAASAVPWSFAEPLAVTVVQGKGIFHHLESAGRKNVAVSPRAVAVAWEDNRSGQPRVYVALKPSQESVFAQDVQVSGAAAAYEPSIVALTTGDFLVAWEEDGRTWVRGIGPAGPGPAAVLDTDESTQVTLAARGGTAWAAWAQRAGRFSRIVVAPVAWEQPRQTCLVGSPRPVEAKSPVADQLYPSLAAEASGVIVAWEDRRSGHTRLLFSSSSDGNSFATPRPLNEIQDSRALEYGKGSGVTRVALAALGDDKVLAAWMDKRDFLSGYDIYAARSDDAGASFGANEKVQDEFGSAIAQWHAVAAGNSRGDAVVAWDDDRDEHSRVWLSWPTQGAWSDDWPLPGAGRQQSNPSAVLDEAGGLHVVWTAQQTVGGPTTLWYIQGRAVTDAP